MIRNPVMEANATWEAKAIEKCKHDKRVFDAGLCYICMKTPPCNHFASKKDARAAMDVRP